MTKLDWDFVVSHLQGGKWHATSQRNFESITSEGMLKRNPSFRNYPNSYAAERGFISYFDFSGNTFSKIEEQNKGNIISCLGFGSESIILDCSRIDKNFLLSPELFLRDWNSSKIILQKLLRTLRVLLPETFQAVA